MNDTLEIVDWKFAYANVIKTLQDVQAERDYLKELVKEKNDDTKRLNFLFKYFSIQKLENCSRLFVKIDDYWLRKHLNSYNNENSKDIREIIDKCLENNVSIG